MSPGTLSLWRGAVLASLFLLAACQTSGPLTSESPADAAVVIDHEPVTLPRGESEAPEEPPQDLWERIRRGLHWHEHDHPAVLASRDAYLQQPLYLSVVGQRAQRYLHYIVEEVEDRGMPLEIALLPLVESTLDPFAVSPQQAAGLWQIMPATAQYLGMHRDWWFDDRLDLRFSTRVALDYLESLYADFGEDWMLALAAYNAGRGRVSSALQRNEALDEPIDYWSLTLPLETQHYVPRLLALAEIIRHAKELSAELPPVPNAPAFIAVPTGGQIELQRAAQLAGVEIGTLRNYNPGHLRWATAPEREEILLPMIHAERFSQAIATLPEDQRVSWTHYRIRQGDSLAVIARRFRTQVSLLQEVNGIQGHLIRAGDTLLIPRGGDWGSSLALASTAEQRQKRSYTVRSGDSLYRIARQFQVTIDELVDWNGIDRSAYLRPGQLLTLFVRGG